MSANFNQAAPVGPDTLITVKILIDGQNRRFKLALRDLGAHVLPQKLRMLLQINPDYYVVFERYSDSAGNYVVLDSTNPSVYKQLYRAAKAKLKLRLKVTASPPEKLAQPILAQEALEHVKRTARPSYLQTVLAEPSAVTDRAATFKPFQQQIHAPSATTLVEPVDAPKTTQAPTDLSRPTIPNFDDFCTGNFSIDCNNCANSVDSEHFHCGICEMGDFDLCPACVRAGITCDGEDHWLIKRTINHGRVYPSITEKVPPKKVAEPVKPVPAPAAAEEDQRTCNSCIIQLPATSFVSCQACADFDLCFLCLENGDHGHHPAHAFAPVDKTAATVTTYINKLCQQGRGIRHEAVCDGCDAQIVGVRHKCLFCPDFDLCSSCHMVVADTHPGHRFAPIYDQLGYLNVRKPVHKGVYCDGIVCEARSKKTYIRGDRYKCAVCNDTDFCANCEAHPLNTHNKTHPLIKLKSPIRQVSISTVTEFDDGQSPIVMGDRSAAQNLSLETVRTTSTNAATEVQRSPQPAEEKSQPESATKTDELQAWFESDSTPDGSRFGPNRLVSQSWTLRNPGPQSWPTGCAVHFIGGDDIRNLDDKYPSAVSSMTAANQSNALTEPLAPGKTATFTVLLKSPAREGRAISYWRLKTPEGLPFGHKLWVDITIDAKLSSVKPVEVEAPAAAPVEAPVETSVSPKAEQLAEKSQESSIMIFPKLEKESAESSINDIKQETLAIPEPSVVGEDQDLLDDLESMGIEDESTDDGFMTDEEYDILDAEDEDFLAEAQAAAKK